MCARGAFILCRMGTQRQRMQKKKDKHFDKKRESSSKSIKKVLCRCLFSFFYFNFFFDIVSLLFASRPFGATAKAHEDGVWLMCYLCMPTRQRANALPTVPPSKNDRFSRRALSFSFFFFYSCINGRTPFAVALWAQSLGWGVMASAATQRQQRTTLCGAATQCIEPSRRDAASPHWRGIAERSHSCFFFSSFLLPASLSLCCLSLSLCL
nr:hypothetical protein [Pandoravirus massiliensis]